MTRPLWDILVLLTVFALSLPTTAWAGIVHIADDATLRAALQRGVQGQVLVLSSGVYSPLLLRSGNVPTEIRSENPVDPAHVRGFDIAGFDGLRITNLILEYRFDAADPINVRPFSFSKGTQLEIENVRVIGDRARNTGTENDGYGYGIGLSVRFTDGVRITKSLFSGWHRGLIVSESKNILIAENEVTKIRMDGMNFAQVENIHIEYNHIHSFARNIKSADHADMIQFWTASTTEASTDIVIRGNVLNSGEGIFTQSIFMRNERVDKGEAGSELFYHNVLIEENVILNAQLHGITLGESDGVTIRNNTLIQNHVSAGGNPSDLVWQPSIRIVAQSRGVEITRNIVHSIHGSQDQSDWRNLENLIIQNRSLLEPNHYSKVFPGWAGGDPTDIRTYRYRQDLVAVGAARLRP